MRKAPDSSASGVAVLAIAAVAHGVIDDPVLHHSTLLLVAFLIVGGTGIGAYAYRELFARYVIPIHDYTVSDLQRLNESTLAVNLDPVGKPLAFVAGQFVFLAFGGPGRWQRHPFSVSSAPSKRRLEVTVKAVGDYTSSLADWLRPGLPAKLVGPFGGFDFRHGDEHQIWIALGIGITPFLSWIRSLDGTLDRSVDLYYCAARRADAIYLDEILAMTDHLISLRLHPVFSDTDSHLTADRVMQSVPAGGRPLRVHVRSAADDEGIRKRFPAARRSSGSRAMGAVRCALSANPSQREKDGRSP
jgi:predicted ferric reductase